MAKEISSEKTEWSGSISFSFQVESFTGAISHLPETESREDINSFFISKYSKRIKKVYSKKKSILI
jgi:hypothetical protein